MAEKLAIKSRKIPNKPISSNTLVLFPKGPEPIKGVFEIEFGALVNMPKCIVARYRIIPKEKGLYSDMVRDLKPSFNRNFSIIPGIKSSFVVPKATDCLEYAIYVDYDKAKSYFNSVQQLGFSRDTAISMDLIKGIMKTHISRFHKF
jgi:hypothetical protein